MNPRLLLGMHFDADFRVGLAVARWLAPWDRQDSFGASLAHIEPEVVIQPVLVDEPQVLLHELAVADFNRLFERGSADEGSLHEIVGVAVP
jgi:hypothetical protein